MNIFFRNLLIIPALLFLNSCNAPVDNKNTVISINTTLGNIKIKLYDGTPLHRDNFIKLINSGFYENVSFHRIIKDFMIQAGDPVTKAGPVKALPDSMSSYTIPAEFNTTYYHKKGALAAARKGNDVNPEMRSSGTQFYIVQGVRYNEDDLNQAELLINSNIKQSIFNKFMKEISDSIRISGRASTDSEVQELASVKMFDYLTANKEYKITEDQRNVYKSSGGVPRLDGTYTVFGEVIEGLDVVDIIASVPTDSNGKPSIDIKNTKMKILRN
jgi:peptidylprolyl isomerase